MFATNWFMTLFTRIIEFALVYELWEIFLFERDRFLIFYLAVALLKQHRQKILECNQMETVLKYLTNDMKVADYQ